jgi:hypothetical protein
MLKGRGLKTINALPPKPSAKQTPPSLAGQAPPRSLGLRPTPGARWRLPGYEWLCRDELLHR